MAQFRRFAMLCAFGFAVTHPVCGQDTQTTPSIRVESKVVNVTTVVHDASGKPVPDLTRESFAIKEDGKPQQIAYFSYSSDLPLTLALLVDTSSSQLDFIPDEIRASSSFFTNLMTHPKDRAVLMQFDSEIRELAALTNSVRSLEDGLNLLTDKRNDVARSTRLYDAIAASSHLELGDQLGRRAMVLLTDGEDTSSSSKIGAAIEAAQRADIMVYSVYYSRKGGGSRKTLERLSRETGGRVFTVGTETTLKQIFGAISDDMRLAYEIGYRPPDSKPNKFHKIEVQSTDQKLVVQAREGYFSK